MIIQFQDHYNQHYTLTDDLSKTDSSYRAPRHLQSTFEEISMLLGRKNKHTEKKLLQLITDNPGVPQLKNYLTAYYSVHRQNDKAFAYNHQILQEHPDYLFAKVNLALEYITLEQPEKVCGVLGKNLQLNELYPDRQVFHVTEYINYYKIVFRYWHYLKEIDKCRALLADLRRLEKKFDGDFDLEEFDRLLLTSAFEDMLKSVSKQKDRTGIIREAPTLPQTAEEPIFHFFQIRWLYENSFSIEKRKIDELLSLERSLLLEDLSSVLYDAIRRYKFFSEKDYQPETHDFIVHALLLLQHLEAKEALPAILLMLRQPKELLDYWLNDLITEYLWQVVYATGKNQLHLLEEFLKEPLNDTFARSAVSTAISQLALRHPERRQEVVALYKRLLDFYYANKENREIFDGLLTTFVIRDVTDINGLELASEIKRFYEEGLADELIAGKWEKVQQRLQTGNADQPYPKKRKLQHIYELIKEMHDQELQMALEDRKEEPDKPESDYLDYEDVNTEGGSVVYSGYQPYHREEKKVGRNDPCPCGSGLKYKKCHGKNS